MSATSAATLVACALALGIATASCSQLAPSATRTPDVRYDPTPHHVVATMLDLAQVNATDVVYDLGCGDGRIVIAAAQRGARGVCVDIDPVRIRESRENARRAGVAGRITFVEGDLFDTNVADATVVMVFLSASLNLKLRPRLLRDAGTGTRVVSYVHDMGDWKPRETRGVQGNHGPREVFLWIVPERQPAK